MLFGTDFFHYSGINTYSPPHCVVVFSFSNHYFLITYVISEVATPSHIPTGSVAGTQLPASLPASNVVALFILTM